jgi:hypothetical protein
MWESAHSEIGRWARLDTQPGQTAKVRRTHLILFEISNCFPILFKYSSFEIQKGVHENLQKFPKLAS